MSAATITPAHSVAIVVRYCGPTNSSGARFRIFRADGPYREDPDRLTVGYDYGATDAHVAALAQYLARKGDGWAGGWTVAGAGDRDYVAVRTPKGPDSRAVTVELIDEEADR